MPCRSHDQHALGEYLGRQVPPDRYTPRQVHSRTGTPPLGRYIPRQVHALGRYTPRAGTPQPQCMLRYGQQAGGTHPTGMHSCCIMNWQMQTPKWFCNDYFIGLGLGCNPDILFTRRGIWQLSDHVQLQQISQQCLQVKNFNSHFNLVNRLKILE